jgi:DNA-directed RNA polymerase subunit RPC12/RpoP
MNNNTTKKAYNVMIIAIYRDLADDFTGSFVPDESSKLTIGDHEVGIDVFVGDPDEDASFKDRLAKAHAVAILVRFLDVLSLDKIRNMYHHLSQASTSLPVGVFYLRDKGELDFKISCPSCGQKLWLRDTDIGKRGRCPNCSKPFIILSQSDHLKTQLLLPESMPCLKVTRKDNDSFRTALGKLLESKLSGVIPMDVDVNLEAMKHATVRIQVQDS